MFTSYAAIGDSFTEGVGDELPDGRVRGWADFVALGLADAAAAASNGTPGDADTTAHTAVTYANFAIRGRKLAPILNEQLDAAIALKPQLLSLNGGGNDIMRPRVSIASIADILEAAVDRAVESGIHVLLLSGANPSDHLPLGGVMSRRGEELARAVRSRHPRSGVTLVDNWGDAGLRDIRYWSRDHLHLNANGHARVASNVLSALGVPVPARWGVAEVAAAAPGIAAKRDAAYYREYVLPWIGRRLTGRSSGDGRTPKSVTLQPVAPEDAL